MALTTYISSLLRRFSLLPALSLFLFAAGADEHGGLELLILHTNDTHSCIAGIDAKGNAAYDEAESCGGYARIATAIAQHKAKADNVIALDAGDHCQGTLFYTVNRARMLADLNQDMPYDAMVLGNHEFDDGCASAAEFTRTTPFPVLAANLIPTGTCAMGQARIRPCIIREVRGEKVGIIGLSNDEVVIKANACKHTTFTNAEETARRMVAELQAQGVKHIILVTHLGLDVDRELARKVAGVDIIVGGHSHDYLGEGSDSGPYPIVELSPDGSPVLVVTAKYAAQYLGELHVRFDAAGVATSWSGSARELTNDIPPDDNIRAKVGKYAQALNEYRSEVITINHHDMVDGLDESRLGETRAALVVTDAALDFGKAYGAEVALINGGGIRAGLPRGKVTRGDVMTILPFGGTFPVLEVAGECLLAALEHGVSGDKGRGPGLLQVAGMSYVIDASQPVGSRVSDVKVGTEPLNPARTYCVVTSNYIAGGGDGYAMFGSCKQVKTPQKPDAKVLEDYLIRHTPLPMPQTGRLIYK